MRRRNLLDEKVCHDDAPAADAQSAWQAWMDERFAPVAEAR